MSYREKYKELSEAYQALEKELESLRSGGIEKDDIARDTLYKVFHSASALMAISDLKKGIYVDVNDTFLSSLGFLRDEVIGHTPDDIRIFSDFEESNKYIRLIPRLKKIKDYPVTLRTKQGKEKSYVSSAETVKLGSKEYLLTQFSEISDSKAGKIRESQGSVLEEIFETVSSYLALYRISEDNKFYLIDLNSKVEEVEFVRKSEVIDKCIDDTILVNRVKLVELLNHIRITGEAHKLSVSPAGDDSEGYYMGFLLTSGNIVITWEPGSHQKNLEVLNKQGAIFEKFAEMLPQIVYEVDIKGNVLYSNHHGLSFFGYTKEDVIRGLHISDIFPDDYKKMIDNLKSLKNPTQTIGNEYLAKKKDGRVVPVLTLTFASFMDDRIVAYRGMLTDLSNQKEYEENIIREKAFLEHLIDSTPVAIVITAPSGKISMINREFTKLFGYTIEETLNKHINELVVPEGMKDEAEDIDHRVSLSQHEVKETIRKDKSGNTVHVSLVATAIVINEKTVAHLSIYRDISAEKKNQIIQEILYNISTAALNQYDIKEIYPIIVQELNRIWDTNNFFIALYDKDSETLSLPFFSDEKDDFHEIPTRKTITGWVINNKKPVLLKEDDLKVLEEAGDIDLVGTPCKVWMGVPLKVEDKTIGVMCLQDYHDEDKFTKEDLYILEFIANQVANSIQRRMMVDNIILARQKAEAAAQTKQLFMSTMSHEIRTPLNEVIGITNLLLQGNPREDQMDFIKTLKFSGNHLLTLVNDVLDYNKIESGKIIFEQAQFDLGDFLSEIRRSYSFRSQAKNLSFDIVRSSDLPEKIIGDPIRLNQILSNLLSNALKFTHEGGITLSIKEFERTDNSSKIEFSVTDTGIGIRKEMHSTIFDSYMQAAPDTTRQFGGTGLGLSICRKLVELQGGSISLKSEPGKGSTFTVIISFGIIGKETAEPPGETSLDYSGLEGKKILVAEDNKINFFVANKFLVGWGVDVTHAENGQIALDLLRKEKFDLIIMDLHMPVMDGIEATRIIRHSEDPGLRDIPIVALTAAIMSESHDKIEGLNINDYILKPFKPHDLFKRIRRHIR